MKVKVSTPNAPYYSDESTAHLTGSIAFGSTWYWSLYRFFFQGFRDDEEKSKWYYNSWIDFGKEAILIKVGNTRSPSIPYKQIEEIRIQIYRWGEYSRSRYDVTNGSYILIKYNGYKFKYYLSISEEWADRLIELLRSKDVHLLV